MWQLDSMAKWAADRGKAGDVDDFKPSHCAESAIKYLRENPGYLHRMVAHYALENWRKEHVWLIKQTDNASFNAPDQVINGEVWREERGVSMRFDGHGTNDMIGDTGPVVFVELYEGQIWVRLWTDVNCFQISARIS